MDINTQIEKSIGCIDYGNNNFWEVLKDGDKLFFVYHGEYEVLSEEEFWQEVPAHHEDDVLEQIKELLR